MVINIETMIQKGLHFGHSRRTWNPKMSPYIYTEKNNLHIIDLVQTYSHFKQSLKFLADSTAQGKTILFVGTKNKLQN